MSTSTDGDGGKKIKQPSSAFHIFQKDVQQRIKAELQAKGEPCGLGDMQKVVSEQWKAMDEETRTKYEEYAKEDRARYDAECAERDRILEDESARKRREREELVIESRMRGRTEEQERKPVKVKAKRELTEEEQERRKSAQQEKAARQAIIDKQHDALKEEKAKQAEARLQYLLRQSDIFKHFGLKGATSAEGDAVDSGSSKGGAAGGPGRRAKHREHDDAGDDELNEDSQAHFLLQQPSSIKNGQLRAYQLEGLNWMIRLQDNGINGILADEMGLGKTLQSISVLAYNCEYLGVGGPHLILVPKSTLANWCNEFRKWCPSLRVLRFHGPKEERQVIAEQHLNPTMPRDWDVLITTYEIANLEKTPLAKIIWQYLIIDEAHRLKNEASQFSQTVRMLQTAHRLLITGTPLQNNLHELWALLNFLLPEVFSSSDQFDEWFNLQIDDAEQKQRLITQLHKILRPFMLRRLKADVEKTLPKKSETLVFCEMAPLQRETYKKVLERDLSVVAGTENAGRTAVLNIVMQLRKACNHPYLFTGVEDRTLDPLGDHVVVNCGKMILLDKLLKKLKEKGHRVLVFCQMTRMLDILEDFMIMRRHEYCRIDGNTTYEERENLIDVYNAPNSSKFAFLLSTRAGGLGINLQTADTVILFDSDWNPQADLQAQDRAHRIGQKKPVNIYRLVTQGTIEEKIVERAQKKLKLDAMVVQQGRLQDKDKMSRDELLEAIRFGADVIFRSKDANITDEDIDLILERGRKRTAELTEKLQAADKGDLLDFRLDGGMSAQVFEGQDYSKKPGNKGDMGLSILPNLLLDMGKRERKPTQSNLNERDLVKKAMDHEPRRKGSKLPKHLRLPRIDDPWMFFNRERLHELQAKEEAEYRRLKEEEQLPADLKDLQLLSEDELLDKERLLQEGFGDWSKNHFNGFTRASAKYGRLQYDKIALEVGKTEAEVQAYAQVFWDKGEASFSSSEWDKIIKNVEKGEKKLEDIARLTKATQELIKRFHNPWEELTFQHAGAQSKERVFSAEEDRYLLCFTNYFGYGNWDKVKMAIRRCDRFRFDYFLRSCSAENLGKRCEQLMRTAEKENSEFERRRAAMDEQHKKEREERLADDLKRDNEIAERRRKLHELDAKLSEEEGKLQELTETRKAVELRMQMLKGVKAQAAANGGVEHSAVGRAAEAGKGAPGAGAGPAKGFAARPLSDEEHLPVLVSIILKAGADGLAKIVTEFMARFPGQVSKRQIEMKVQQIAHKEKNESDPGRPRWALKPECASMQALAVDLPPLPPADLSPTPVKSEGGGGEKRKRSEGGAAEGASDERAAPKEPKKPRNAVTLYLSEVKESVKRELGPDATNDAIKERVKVLWKQVDEGTKAHYQAKVQEDKERYDREMAEYNRAVEAGGAASSEGAGGDDAQSTTSSAVGKKRSSPDNGEPTATGSYAIPKKHKSSANSTSGTHAMDVEDPPES